MVFRFTDTERAELRALSLAIPRDLPFTDLEVEMYRLLDLIDAEWRSDPQSVACFCITTRDAVKVVLEKYKTQAAENKKTMDQYKKRRTSFDD